MHQQGTSPSYSLSLCVILASYTTCTTGLHGSTPPSFSRLFVDFAPTSSYDKSHVHNTLPSPFPALFSLPPFFPPISFPLLLLRQAALRAFVFSFGPFVHCAFIDNRFADGFRYGFGAEVGVSTGKLHARGPVGLEGLTSYKYLIAGNGQGAGMYSEKGGGKFLHERSI